MARGKLEPKMIEKIWKKGQSGNPNGQPRKGISLVNEELREAGYSPATKQDIEINYMQMLQLEESQLIELSKNKNKPKLVRILAENILGDKGFDIIEKMLDRGIGKTTQTLDNKHSGNLTLTDGLINLTKNPQKEEF